MDFLAFAEIRLSPRVQKRNNEGQTNLVRCQRRRLNAEAQSRAQNRKPHIGLEKL
ncbi:hypothetical protein Pint_11929 [Pistacia integerrima]|uniref:Uncharacterized protein n=1 Tax=Pistacia integerrima TaxID=434235 RepID=A0ACC0XEK7_9ROSI|nr:hypothetical protein Pint_11929 [Pistacia integerrima]